MTATSSPNNAADQQPALYRLAQQGRWSSSSDIRGLYDRLVYLSNLHSSEAPPTSDTENLGVENNEDTPLHSSRNRKRALSELQYVDIHNRRTALHILCYWRPRAHLVSNYLNLTPELVWARSASGETALHMACSNATRMAGVDVIRCLLDAAEVSSSDADHDARRRYALLTDEKGRTALHCAVQADAPMAVLQALLNAAPEAALMADAQSNTVQTPINMLYKTYELFIDQYMTCENEADKDEEHDEDGDINDSSASSDRDDNESLLPDTLCHFWEKLNILLQAGCVSVRGGQKEEELPVLHAALRLLSLQMISIPSSLLQFIMLRCLDQQTNQADAHGNYPLHYAVSAWAQNAIDCAAVQRILDANPNAARMKSSEGRLPLQVLLQQKHTREESNETEMNRLDLIRGLARAYPPALLNCDACSDELAPHVILMLCQENKTGKNDAKEEPKKDPSNAFELLRSEPGLMRHAL